jgi:hypothetical protein
MFRAYFRSKKWSYRVYGGAAAILVLLLAQLKVALMINFTLLSGETGGVYAAKGMS